MKVYAPGRWLGAFVLGLAATTAWAGLAEPAYPSVLVPTLSLTEVNRDIAAPVHPSVTLPDTKRALAEMSLWAEVRTDAVDPTATRLEAAGVGTPALWALVALARAQQRGDSYEMLEASLGVIATAEPGAPIPLPASAWFLLMGVLGMAGAHWTGRTESVAGEATRGRGHPGAAGSTGLAVNRLLLPYRRHA
jgi:hypothetical protein